MFSMTADQSPAPAASARAACDAMQEMMAILDALRAAARTEGA